jgi:hypothetical protein
MILRVKSSPAWDANSPTLGSARTPLALAARPCTDSMLRMNTLTLTEAAAFLEMHPE